MRTIEQRVDQVRRNVATDKMVSKRTAEARMEGIEAGVERMVDMMEQALDAGDLIRADDAEGLRAALAKLEPKPKRPPASEESTPCEALISELKHVAIWLDEIDETVAAGFVREATTRLQAYYDIVRGSFGGAS